MFTNREFTAVVIEDSVFDHHVYLTAADGAVAEIADADQARALRLLASAGLVPQSPLLLQSA